MNRPSTVIKLLLIEDSLEDAEQLISMLRNAGIAVRPERASEPKTLEETIAKHAPDVILVNPECRDLELAQAVEIATRAGRDVALIAYGRGLDDAAVAMIGAAGVPAVALRDHADHVQQVVRREFDALQMRRSVRQLQAALRDSERRADSLLDSSRDPIAYVHEGMHVRANRAYLDMFGHEDFDELEGLSILDLIAPEDAGDFRELLKRLSRGEKPPQRLNLKARHSSAELFDATIEFAAASYGGEQCQQVTFRQQALDAELAQELDALRSRDPITGLLNRAHVISEIERIATAAAGGETEHALLLIEPDNFRQVIDTIGLGNTDTALAEMASVLRRHLSDADIPGRLGDHTFGVLSSARDMDETNRLADTLRKAFEDRIFEAGQQSINMTVSVGGTLIGERNADSEQIVTQAYAALRQVQEDGGNQLSINDPSAQDRKDAEQTAHWRNLIENALANEGFVLYFQPVMSLHGADGDFYEVLIRMETEKGDILPGKFLPAAEQHGLLPAIDRWVIGQAIRTLGQRQARGEKMTLFVKLATQSLADRNLLPWIGQQLRNAAVPPEALVLQLQESKVITALKPAAALVAGLKELGCGFALEQFGSGLNSFQLLRHIPADYLKIDRSYTADLANSKENQTKIKEICTQAREVGKATVAEFVEDAASMSILFSCGADFAQGNFLQEPAKLFAAETA